MARAEWAAEARRYGGSLVVWIEQGADPGLHAANSNGVCHAMTVDWIMADTFSRAHRGRFVNAFRRYDEGDRWQSDGHVPQTYLDQQARYATNLRAYNSLVDSAQQLMRAHQAPRPAWVMTRLRTQHAAIQGFRRGVYRGFEIQRIAINGPAELPAKMASHQSYYMFSMLRPGQGGHVVGFEQRAGVNISENYPDLYEYLDANLGLFAFSRQQDMLGFFIHSVWPTVYRDAYDGGNFKLVRVALQDQSEGLDPDLDDLEAELEELEREAAVNRPTGAFWRVWETSLSAGETCWRCGTVHGEWRSFARHWHRCRTCRAVYCPGCGWNLPRYAFGSRDRRCTLNNCGGRTQLV